MIAQFDVPELRKFLNWPIFLLLMLCINVIGLLLKMAPWLNNRFIPWICLTIGCIVYPFVADVGMEKPVLHNWWVVHMLGILAGAAAWGAHDRFLRRFEKYLNVPGLKLHGYKPKYHECRHRQCPHKKKAKH